MDSVKSLVICVSNWIRQKYLSKSETEKSENIYQFIISEQYATSLWNPWRRDASNTLLTKGRAVEVYQNLSFLKVPFQDQDLRTTASNIITAIEVVSQSRSHFANFLLRTCCKSDNDTTKQRKLMSIAIAHSYSLLTTLPNCSLLISPTPLPLLAATFLSHWTKTTRRQQQNFKVITTLRYLRL